MHVFFFSLSRFPSNYRSYYHVRQRQPLQSLQTCCDFSNGCTCLVLFHPSFDWGSCKLPIFLIVVPMLTDYIRPSTLTLALLPTPQPLLCRVHRLLCWVHPLSSYLVCHNIRQPFQRLCMHWHSWQIKDWLLHRPSITSLKPFRLKSRTTLLNGLRWNQRQMKRGGSP